MRPDIEGALRFFFEASRYSSRPSRLHEHELEWQRRVRFEDFTETDLLRETAWVILCSGFREKIVRSIFDYVSLCFCDWESAKAIIVSNPICQKAALPAFRNRAKLDAIVSTAEHIEFHGFSDFKKSILESPIIELQKLPYIGKITSYHLAKNLGLDTSKPDRHLLRISSSFGFENADHFCSEVSRLSGEKKNVVDLIIWRYMADNRHINI